MKPSRLYLGSILVILGLVQHLALLAGPVPTNKPAAYPAWWFERDVIARLPASANKTAPVWPTDYPPADDYAAVNQGQVKNVAKQSFEKMKAAFLDGAGQPLNDIWASPVTSSDDYLAINLGQLKALAKPFYDRLAQIDPIIVYPWGNPITPADDFALVNIGQVKNLFRFDPQAIAVDTDGDGLPDKWELYYFGNLSRNGTADWNNDGMLDRDAFRYGLDPFKRDNDGDGMIDGYEITMGLNPLLSDGAADKDGDLVINQEDARPNDPAIGRLSVAITAPADNSILP